jgi:hypothetical protein
VSPDWNARAFPSESLAESIADAHRFLLERAGNLEGLFGITERDLADQWFRAADDVAAGAISELSFDQVALAACWNDQTRKEVFHRALDASLEALPAGVHASRCLVTVPEQWRSVAERYQALFQPCAMPIPEIVAVSLAPVTAGAHA